MIDKPANPHTITIHYDTAILPAPYAHSYTLALDLSAEEFKVDLKLQYYDRDDLTQDEIQEEGYTGDDDYTWQGHLIEGWRAALVDLYHKTTFRAQPDEEHSDSLILTIQSATIAGQFYPSQPHLWSRMAQELIQAIFEGSQRELPLVIRFRHKSSGSTTGLDLTFHFSTRHCTQHQVHKQSEKIIDWADGQQLMKKIYAIDYLQEEGSEKLPGEDGHYIDPGEGRWHSLTGTKAGQHHSNLKQKLADTLKEMDKD
jgi:hypothetical protein